MSVVVQQRGDRHQLRVTHRLLPKPFIHTFAQEGEARAYGRQLHDLLDKGVVPAALLEQKRVNTTPVVDHLIAAYLLRASPAPSDVPLLTRLDVPQRVHEITFEWAEAWVTKMKARKLAPSTIRKHVESLARVLDWHARSENRIPANPLRHLATGYSTYEDGTVRDEARAYRLGEHEAAVRDALAGVKRKDRERAWPADDEFRLLFELIVGTGLRLSEAFTLRVDQLDAQRAVLNIDGAKGHRGRLKPRTVPLVPALRQALAAWCEGRSGLMFSYWDGTPADKARCSKRLSSRFKTLFEYSGAGHLTSHDLRHEAACRWVSMKKGRSWLYNEAEICKILGWDDTKMMLRYASLRGEDLSARLTT